MVFLIVDDLLSFSPGIDPLKAQSMIDDASALAVLAAPCLGVVPSTLTVANLAALKALLRGAILRWDDSGSGALSAQTAGAFSQTLDTRQVRRGMFWPGEIAQLRDICGGTSSGAFTRRHGLRRVRGSCAHLLAELRRALLLVWGRHRWLPAVWRLMLPGRPRVRRDGSRAPCRRHPRH